MAHGSLSLRPVVRPARPGCPASRPTTVLLAGWPDTQNVWRPICNELDTRCVCLCLPGYDEHSRPEGLPPLGYNFPSMARMTADALSAEVEASGAPVTLVLHDWGVVLGLSALALRPALASSVVLFDIGAESGPGATASRATTHNLRELLLTASYQLALAAAFLLSRIAAPLGDCLVRLWFASPLSLLVVPLHHGDARHFREARAAAGGGLPPAWMGWPYFHTWAAFARGKMPFRLKLPKGVPFSFCYGAGKPIFFHSPAFEQRCEREAVVFEAVEGGGHWFFLDNPKRFAQVIERTAKAAAARDDM